MKKNSIYFRIWGVLLVSLIIFLGIFSQNNISYSDTCEYTTKIDQCMDENTKSWGSTRSIEDFVCLTSGNKQDIAFQIILDEEFKGIDDEVERYLDGLERDKDRYFWKNKEVSYIQGIDYITEIFSGDGKYWKKYYDACGVNIIEKVQSCQGWEIWIKKAASAFQNGTCSELADIKLKIYEQVAFDILMLNKVQVRKDAMKQYVIQERKKYNNLLDVMMVNIWYI